MSARTDRYNSIISEYDALRSRNEAKRKARYKTVCEKIPRIAQIDKEIEALGISSVRQTALNPKNTAEIVSKLKCEIEKLEKEKESLIAEAFPKGYLDMEYSCADCKDTGFVDGKRCHCLTNKILEANYDMSNIKNVLKTENFAFFDVNCFSNEVDEEFGMSPRENMLQNLDRAMSFCSSFPNGRNLMFFGNPGLGKTFLCNCIAKELLDQNRTVIYTTGWQLFKKFADATFRCEDDDETYNSLLDDILTCDLLIVDDLGTELVNSFTLSEFFNIINQRLNASLSVILSTNHSIDELTEKYSERIVSRIIGDYEILRFFGNDLRIMKLL